MREIKFRGCALSDGKWRYGGIHINDEGRVFIVIGSFPDKSIGWCFSEVDPKTVGEYTGLHDKNGREIYEGDILHFDLQDYQGGDHFYTLPVDFLVDCYGFPYKSEPSEPDCDCCISLGEAVANDDELEVIGNIHETPELLEKTNE